MIKYQDRVFEFTDIGIQLPTDAPIKVSFGGIKTDVKTIEKAEESAKAFDDFQHQLCVDLENKSLKEQLDKETWTKYIKTRFAANALVLTFRETLYAFRNDPSSNHRDNLDGIIKDMRYLVDSLSGDIVQKYNTEPGHDSISAAISRINKIDQENVVDEHQIDELLSDKFEEFEKTQREILKKITEVKAICEESQNKSILEQSKIGLITSEDYKKIKSGKRNIWLEEYFDFDDGEIISGYDARRPLTDEVIKSIENNLGTIIFGDPYTGKSILLKRIVFELTQRGYVVLFGDNIEAFYNSIRSVFNSVTEKYDKVVLIADNAHKSSTEAIFEVFTKVEDSCKGKFLFAAREKQLSKENPVISRALSDIPSNAQFSLNFDINYARLLFEKAIQVTFQREPSENEMQKAHELYQYCKGDPLMFNMGLKHFLSGQSKTLENFIEIKMSQIIKRLDEFKNNDTWNAAIFACLIGIPDLILDFSKSTADFIGCSNISLDDIRFLGEEGILIKQYGHEQFRIRHEKFAYEFLSLLYRHRYGNNEQKFNQKFNINEIMLCIWNNMNVDKIIDTLRTCSYLNTIEDYRALSKLITSQYVKPTEEFVVPSNFSKNEKARLLSYGLGNFYTMLDNYKNALAYYDKSLEISENIVTTLTTLFNRGLALHSMGRYQEAIETYDKVLKLYTKNANVFIGKGMALQSMGKLAEAVTWYDKALAIDSKNVDALANKGGALDKMEGMLVF
jgi:tetratricopeptide (TPR) repeat protein